MLDQLEDADEYRTFEKAVVADLAPTTIVEQVLVLRLASLPWRLKRATARESGLLQSRTQTISVLPEGILGEIVQLGDPNLFADLDPIAVFLRLIVSLIPTSFSDHPTNPRANGSGAHAEMTVATSAIAQAFYRLATTTPASLELVLRYQTSLSRQLIQTSMCIAQVRQFTKFAHFLGHKARKAKRPH